MLELFFGNVSIFSDFKIQAGVGWQFCLLAGHFENRGLEAYFKDGEFVVTSDRINFRALDDWNTICELKLSEVEKGAIQFGVPNRKPLFPGSPLRGYEKEDKEIDMAAFLNDWDQKEKITICERRVESERKESYTEMVQMEVDRKNDILRFYVTITYQPEDVESPQEEDSYKARGSRIKTMTLDGEVTFDFADCSFMKTMKKIVDYCERKNLNISVRRRDYMLPGHCIDIPHTVITTDDFEIIFEFESVSMVYVAKSIMDGTYYTDTAGGKYNIGE